MVIKSGCYSRKKLDYFDHGSDAFLGRSLIILTMGVLLFSEKVDYFDHGSDAFLGRSLIILTMGVLLFSEEA